MPRINEITVKDPDILGGTAVFRGTRVPCPALLDYPEGGQRLNEFLDDFPTVSREVAISALELVNSLVVGELGSKFWATNACRTDSRIIGPSVIAGRFQRPGWRTNDIKSFALAAQQEYEIFSPTAKGVEDEQNLRGLGPSITILRAKSNQLAELLS